MAEPLNPTLWEAPMPQLDDEDEEAEVGEEAVHCAAAAGATTAPTHANAAMVKTLYKIAHEE